MARPWKHPDSGVYWFRKGVPVHLRTLVGKREEKVSLQTKDSAEARVRHGRVAADVAARWADLQNAAPRLATRLAPTPRRELSEREAHEIARIFYDNYLTLYSYNPSKGFWKPEVGQTLWRKFDSKLMESSMEMQSSFDDQWKLERWCADEARDYAAHLDLQLNEAGLATLARATGAAVHSASLNLQRLLQGDYQTVQHSLNSLEAPHNRQRSVASEVSFESLLKGWQSEKVPSAKTVYAWRRVMDQFGAHLGHTDASRRTPDDVVAWKNTLIQAGRKGKTIRDGKVAPLRAILQWGVNNRLLKENVAEKVTISAKSKLTEKIRGYTDEEAKLLLSAALEETDPLRRRVPWICAYTGARVAEVCQLQAEALHQRDGLWFLKLAPEAGSLKNVNSERALPVHTALLQSGFLQFITGVASRPLFTCVKSDRFGSRGDNGTKVLSRWVREQGLSDLRISPNHSWRHRFKTLGRRHGLASDIVNALTGHGSKTVADNYGEFELAALARELEKIPSMQL